jgi:hypothetical protein
MNWLKSKTILFNMVLAAFGVLETANFIDLAGETYAGPAVVATGFIGAWLRKVTTVPLSAK